MFGAIIIKVKLMELLMLCHVFSFEEPVFFELFCTISFLQAPLHQVLSAKRTSSVHYFSSGMYSKYFGIKTTRELVVYMLPLLKPGDVHRKNVPAKNQLDGWEDVWEEVEEVVHHQEMQSIPNRQQTWMKLAMIQSSFLPTGLKRYYVTSQCR